MKLLISVVALTACTPAARMPAQYFAETAAVLPPGQVVATGAFGGGADLGGYGEAGAGRVRVGIDGDQEVGIEGSFVRATAVAQDLAFDGANDPPQTIVSRGYAAKLSYKRFLTRNGALILGTGAASTARIGGNDPDTTFQGTSATADAGVLFSTTAPFQTTPYVGARIGVSVPITGRDMDAQTAVATELSAGIATRVSTSVRLFAEAGLTTVVTPTGDGVDATFGESVFSSGAYALLGVGVTLGQ